MNTIKNKNHIEYIFNSGKKISLPGIFILYVIDRKISGDFCFVAGKKNGNAVWRNQAKRRLRELIRNFNFKKDVKIVFIAKKNINSYSFQYLKGELKNKMIFKGLIFDDKKDIKYN